MLDAPTFSLPEPAHSLESASNAFHQKLSAAAAPVCSRSGFDVLRVIYIFILRGSMLLRMLHH